MVIVGIKYSAPWHFHLEAFLWDAL